jgi:NAD(P)-dependent dehydrogenase (short-subunit alcohol dehydrogenase family)
MKVIITGSTGLAKNIKAVIEATPYLGDSHTVNSVRVEDSIDWNEYDVFINCAHVDFEQVELLQECFEAFKSKKEKTIVNISSRAHQPNISKGYKYAAQKAALNHLSNNLVYNNVEKQCRIMTLNLGLLNHPTLPSLDYNEVSGYILRYLTWDSHLEIPEVTLQHSANYLAVQHQKELDKLLQE